MNVRRIAIGLLATISMIAASLALTIAVAPAASARTPDPGSVGNDVSYPQCGQRLPGGPTFGIVGVNGGRSFTRNGCLVHQLDWAKRAANHGPAFYMNTGNPGPYYTSRWPIGQTWPRTCSSSSPNSSNCSYDYGWNAAKYAFNVASSAVWQLDHVSRWEARMRAAAVPWWLDVETMNSWQTLESHYGPSSRSKTNDTAALSGMVRALWDVGISRVGIYSTSFQWKAITGGRSYTHDWFTGNAVWLAGYESLSDARSGCWDRSFTGGPVQLTQFLRRGFDANVRCR